MTLEKKTVLVLGTNAGQADLIRYMKARGWYVVACANRTGGAGETLCDKFEPVDVRDVDAVKDLAQRVHADLVYSVSSDIAMTTAVAVSEAIRTPHFFDSHLVDLLNDKPSLRRHLDRARLSPVAFREARDLDDIDGWTHFPSFVKPANSQGQRGVSYVESFNELRDVFAAAAAGSMTDGAVLIEEFLDGVEVCCNTLVHNGDVVICELSERLVNSGNLSAISRGHLIPCVNVSGEDQELARDLVKEVVSSLDVREGCFYFQIKITKYGPRIVEIAPRVDGGHVWRLMSHACGLDFLDATMKCLLQELDTLKRRPPERTYEMMFFQMPPGQVFRATDFPVPANALYSEYRYHDGDTVLPVNGSWEVVGYYIRRLSSEQTRQHLVT